MSLRRLACLAASSVLFVACGGGGGGTQPPEPTPTPTVGSMIITLAGVPLDVRSVVLVRGPGGYEQSFTELRINNLVPGDYTIVPSDAVDRSMFYSAPTQVVSVRAGQTTQATVTFALRIPARTTAIRPGQISLAERVQLLYLVPQDGVDRGLDTSGVIHRSVGSGQRWLASQTNGRWIRHDLNGAARLDVTFVRLARTEAAYYAYGAAIRDSLEQELGRLGLTLPNLSLLAYYEGRSTVGCSASAWPPSVPGRLAVLFLNGRADTATPCATNRFADSTTAPPGYWEFVTQRELLHLMGLVSAGARDFVAGGYVGNDPTDLMYAGPLAWRPAIVDVAKSNYYNDVGLPVTTANFINAGAVVTR